LFSGAHDDAKKVSRHAVLRYRAELIADYETIDKPFGNKKGNPRYIYFIGESDYIEEWLANSERARENHKNFLAESDGGNLWYYDDNDDDDEGGHSHDLSYSTINSTSTDSDSITSQVPISLYWFVDEDENVKKGSSNIKASIKSNNDLQDNMRDEIKTLQDTIRSMEENIKLLLLQKK